MIDLIREYESAKAIILFMEIEAFIVAVLAGAINSSFWVGLATFFGVGLIYMIPVIGQAVGIFCSLVEAIFIYTLAIELGELNPVGALYLFVIAFFVLTVLHNTYVGISDLRYIGFGWLVFESFIIGFFGGFALNSVLLGSVIFILSLILSVIPYIRVFEFLALSICTGYIVCSVFLESAGKFHSIISGIILFVYSSIMYVYVYNSLDYIGRKKSKKEEEQRMAKLAEYNIVRGKVYSQYTNLEKEYYYFRSYVCVDNEEVEEFEKDWEKYIYYLNNNLYITFNTFFENEKMYIYRFYNREYAKNSYNNNKGTHADNINMDIDSIVYFKGIKSMEGLKRRYRDLLKIYHTDNPYGDNEVCQNIQQEYEILKRKYEVKGEQV